MSTSCNIDTISNSKNFEPCNLKSIPKKEYILIAIGLIILIGSLIATGCLFRDLGHMTFAFLGVGLAICTICLLLASYFCTANKSIEEQAIAHKVKINRNFSDADRLDDMTKNSQKMSIRPSDVQQPIQVQKSMQQTPYEDTKSEGTQVLGSHQKKEIGDLAFNRLPCEHEGNSCFVNTALQIMAHLSDFRRLFDPHQNKLEKMPTETEDAFGKRQRFQKEANRLILCILRGEKADKLQNFIQAFNDALAAKYAPDPAPISPSIDKGGDTLELLMYIESLFQNTHSLIFNVNSSVSYDLRSRLAEDEQSLKVKNIYPIIRVKNDTSGGMAFRPEVSIPEIGTYRLEAIATSTGFNRANVLGHAVPIIRANNGKYMRLDDLTGQVEEVDEDTLLNLLGSNKGWQAAYYVKVCE